MNYALKVKLKTLAAESRYIRHEINKRKVKDRTEAEQAELQAELRKIAAENVPAAEADAKEYARKLRLLRRINRAKQRLTTWYERTQQEIQELAIHKQLVVRPAARSTHLAYGFLRGREAKRLEAVNYYSLFENTRCYHEVRRLVLQAYDGPLGKDDIIKALEGWLSESAGYVVQLPGGSLPAIQPQPPKALA